MSAIALQRSVADLVEEYAEKDAAVEQAVADFDAAWDRLGRAPEPSAEPATQRGGNSRASEDPMTLEQALPGLAGSPAGTAFAVADDVPNITGPANAMMRATLKDQSGRLIAQIKAIDPTWHYDEIVPTDASGHPIKPSKACRER